MRVKNDDLLRYNDCKTALMELQVISLRHSLVSLCQLLDLLISES